MDKDSIISRIDKFFNESSDEQIIQLLVDEGVELVKVDAKKIVAFNNRCSKRMGSFNRDFKKKLQISADKADKTYLV